MYCAACELEIKGDNKDECPVCGSSLSDNPHDGSALTGPYLQEHSTLQGIIEDINSLIDQSEKSPAEEVFVLRDYEPDTPPRGNDDAPVAVFDEPIAREPSLDSKQEVQPHPMDDIQQRAASMSAMLDSISNSPGMPEPSREENADVCEEPWAADVSDGFLDSRDVSSPDAGGPDMRQDGSQGFLSVFDDEPEELTAPVVMEPRRSLVPALVLVIVLLVCGGYYAFNVLSGAGGRDEVRIVRNQVPLAALQADAKKTENAVNADLAPDAPATAKTAPAAEILPPAATADDDSLKKALTAQQSVAVVPLIDPAKQAEAQQPVEVQKPAEAQKTVSVPVPAEPAELSAPPAASTVAPPKTETSRVIEKPARRQSQVSAPFYTIHSGSYRKQEVAQAEAARVKAKGHDSFVERVDLGQGGIWFRVKVGRFKTKAEADVLKSKINKVLVPDSRVVLHREG